MCPVMAMHAASIMTVRAAPVVEMTIARSKFVAKPEWGTKRTCPKCGTRFYDLQKADPITCIDCGHEWVPESILKSKQTIPSAAAKKVKPKLADSETDLGDDEDDDLDLGDDEDIELDDDDDVDISVEDDDEDDDVASVVGAPINDED